MKFRKDINGLRAIAVIAVVLFHFNENWVPGGFAGVDVFFVISGFLMTGIIFSGLEKNSFSLINFYISRANRIIPALAVLCISLLILGWFFLGPLDYKTLGKHVGASVGFFSNIVYWRESGYFDASSHEKWLLHTWSLSVEWQFYILYPIALVILRKYLSITVIKKLVGIAMLLSFALCIVATYRWPTPTYYLLPTRMWEMMLGGVALLYPLKTLSNRQKISSEWLGIAFIVLSYVLISKENPWPSYLSFFPVVGAFLIIQAHREDSWITGNLIFQKLGKWSYSIYLWHWPVVVVMYYFSLESWFIYIGICLSVLLGFLSYRYVESLRFNKDLMGISGILKCKPVYFAALALLLGGTVFINNGFKWHYDDRVVAAAEEAVDKNPYECMEKQKFPCYIGNRDNIKAIIVGDSHADALTTSLASVFNLTDAGIIALTKSSCPFIIGLKYLRTGDECTLENQRRLTFLQHNYTNVPLFWVARSSVYIYGQSNPDRIKDSRDTKPLISFSDHIYQQADDQLLLKVKQGLQTTLTQLNSGRQIYLVQPVPEMRTNVPRKISRSLLLGQELPTISISESLYLERNREMRRLLASMATQNNVSVLDPSKYLCRNNICYGEHNNRPLYFDGDHMSEYGNKLLTPMFRQAIMTATSNTR